ncbi:MAG: hypothetical protein ACXAB7_07430 [Candidatus Kariarchaeaceae archaeon]|jgi:hypothetical protein
MSLFTKINRWLRGSFECKKCGSTFLTFGFGYGECICPNCYQGESQFLFYDNTFFLNRISSKWMMARRSSIEQPTLSEDEEIILDEIMLESEFREYIQH